MAKRKIGKIEGANNKDHNGETIKLRTLAESSIFKEAKCKIYIEFFFSLLNFIACIF